MNDRYQSGLGSGDYAGGCLVEVIGSAGANRALRFLRNLVRAGAGHLVTAIGLAEFDGKTRDEFFRQLPPVFRPRVKSAHHTAFPKGFASRPPEEVGSDRLRAFWQPAFDGMMDRVDMLYRRHDALCGDPGLVIIFGSLGGHAVLTEEAARQTRDRYPRAVEVVSLPFPRSPHIRGWAREMIERIQKSGADLVVCQDDNGDSELHDRHFAAALTAALAGYSFGNSQPGSGDNFLISLVPHRGRGGGHLAIHSCYDREIPARCIFKSRWVSDLYSVPIDTFQMELHRGLELVGRRNSVDYSPPGGQLPETAELRLFWANIDRESFTNVGPLIRASRQAIGKRDLDVESVFLPLPESPPLDQDTAICSLGITVITPVADPKALLDCIFAQRSEAPSQSLAPTATAAYSAKDASPHSFVSIVTESVLSANGVQT